MKHMRVLTLLVLVCMLAGCASAYAAGAATLHVIPELNLTLELPQDYVFFTRSTPEDDPDLARFGLSHDLLMNTLTSTSMYGNGWPESIDCELTVTMVEMPSLESLKDAPAAVQQECHNAIVKEFNNMGWTVSESALHHLDNATFVEIQYTQASGGSTDSLIQFSTVVDHRTINFTLRSYGDPLTEAEKQQHRDMCAGVNFDAASTPVQDMSISDLDFSIPAYNPGEISSAKRFSDPLTKASFAYPEGWEVEEELFEPGETSLTLCKDGRTYMIVYTGVDLYDSMSAELGPLMSIGGFSREDINNNFFELTDIADLFSTTTDKVHTVTFGNAEFYTANLDATESGQGFHVYYALCYNNGYMHLMMYMGDDDACVGEFEAVMDTFTLG